MKTVAAQAVPVRNLTGFNGNGAGHTNGNGAHPNGNGQVDEAALVPHLTAQGLRKLLERENNPCGPALFITRLRAVKEAEADGEPKLLAGALEDLAAAAVGWSYRVRMESGIWPKSKTS